MAAQICDMHAFGAIGIDPLEALQVVDDRILGL